MDSSRPSYVNLALALAADLMGGTTFFGGRFVSSLPFPGDLAAGQVSLANAI